MKNLLKGFALTATLALGACATTPQPQSPNPHHPHRPHQQALKHLTDVKWEEMLPPELARIALVKNAAYIRFNSQNQRFEGNDGCNSISGNYQADNRYLKLGEILSTKRACLSGNPNGSVSFTYALQQTRQYRFDHGNLELLDDSGNVVLRLRQVSR